MKQRMFQAMMSPVFYERKRPVRLVYKIPILYDRGGVKNFWKNLIIKKNLPPINNNFRVVNIVNYLYPINFPQFMVDNNHRQQIESEAGLISDKFLSFAGLQVEETQHDYLPEEGSTQGSVGPEQFQLYFTILDTQGKLVLVYQPSTKGTNLYVNYFCAISRNEKAITDFEQSELVAKIREKTVSVGGLEFKIPEQTDLFRVTPKKLVNGNPLTVLRVSGHCDSENYKPAAQLVGDVNRLILDYTSQQ